MWRYKNILSSHPCTCIFIFGLILRLFWAKFIVTGTPSLDDKVYLDLAQHLALHNEFLDSADNGLRAYRPIGYPAFLSVFFRFFHHPEPLIIAFQAIISSVIAVMIYIMSFKLFKNKSAAFITAIAYAGLPSVISLCVNFWSETLNAFLLLCAFYFAMDTRSFFKTILAGCFLGLACFFRANIILLLPLFYLPIILERKWNAYISKTLLLGITVLVITLPWSYRNYKVLNQFCWISSNMGVNLYLGHNPEADGTAKQPASVDSVFNLQFNEMQLSEKFSGLAGKYAFTHPKRELELFFIKLTRVMSRDRSPVMFSFVQSLQPTFSFLQKLFAAFNNLLYLFLLLPFVYLFKFRLWKHFPEVSGIFISIWTQFLFYATVVADDRYKHITLPLMCILATFTVKKILERNSQDIFSVEILVKSS